jgi:peptidoglycan-associated lipoprotein
MKAMSRASRLASLVLASVVLAIAPACKKAAPKTVPESPTPAPAVSTQAPPPRAETAAPRTDDVLSQDLDSLNRRGYLKDAFFDYDQATLRDDARMAIAAGANWLKSYPSVEILIEGHCDERGTTEYNLALGQRRADAVREYIGSLGLEGSRVKTVSYGKERPFCTDSTESCWQQNRRAHMLITGK